jgi:hypothetical protein
LNTAVEGLRIQPNDPTLRTVVDSLLADAQNATQQARTMATRAGAATLSQKTFSEAVMLQDDAARSRALNRNEAAIHSFWRAAEGFELAARQATSEQARLKQLQDELVRDRQNAAGPQYPGASRQPGSIPGGPTAERKVAEDLPPPPVNKPPAAETARVPAVGRIEEEGRVKTALQRYEAAFDNLDAAALKMVYPGAPEELGRRFTQYEFYRLEIIIERIVVSADASSATAVCRLNHYFQPKGAARQQNERRQEFTFQKRGDTWFITQVR